MSTHHHACDCREELFAKEIKRANKLADRFERQARKNQEKIEKLEAELRRLRSQETPSFETEK